MGRKKTTGKTPPMQFRATEIDRAFIAVVNARLKDIDGGSDNTRAIRHALRFTANLGIPLKGEVGGGKERWKEYDKTESVPVSVLAPDDVVAYRVRGDSMIDRHIVTGDYVLIRPQETADHGETVVAWIRGTGGVVKCYDAMTHGLYSGKGKEKWEYKLEKGDRLFGVYAGVIRRG